MEPHTSSFPAASPAAVVLEHGAPSSARNDLLAPAFSPAPSPGLVVPASGSGSESRFPAAAATLPPVGYDLFGSPEQAMAAATPLPALLGGLWEPGDSSSSMAAPVLPDCPSPGMFGFAAEYEYSAAWATEEMSPPLFSPWSSSSAGGLAPPQSSDDLNLVGFAQPSSDSDMEPLPPIASPAVEESPVVDAPMPPVEEEEDEDEEEEEEIDVSDFLVSDLEDQPPNASWTATSPQMAGSGAAGGGANASSMSPASTGNNWPPEMLALAAASARAIVSTSSGSMACHSGGSSIGVVSSVGNILMPSSPVLPMVPPLSQGAGGASGSNFNGFARPFSSSSILAPPAPNLQGPRLLPVKEEVMEMEYADGTARRHPDFISLVDDDDEDDVLYQDAIFNSWGSKSSSTASFAPGSWSPSKSSSTASFAPGSWSPSFGPGSWGAGSSRSSTSFAPGSWGSSGGSPSFASGSWGSSGDRLSFAPGSSGGGGSSSSRPSFAPSSSGSSRPSFTGTMPYFNQRTSIGNYDGSSSMQRPSTRGKMSSISGLPQLPRSSVRDSTSSGGASIVFTDPEMAIIAKDKKLQKLLRTDAKKVKRMLYNRAYSAVAKVRRVMHTKNLERMVVTLEERRKSLCEELQSLKEGSAALRAQQMEMQMTIEELEQQAMLKDVVREGLKADIENLKHLKLK